jgi:uncharacterized protein
MKCIGCGRCCLLLDPYLDVELTFLDDVPLYMIRTDKNGMRWMRRNDDGWGSCIALDLDNMVCTIYNNRPRECREFDQDHPLCKRITSENIQENKADNMQA